MKAKILLILCCSCILTLPATAQPDRKQPGRAFGGTPALPPGAKALKDLAYVPDGHERQKLDLYLPQTGEGPYPLVIWVHGGAWRAGSKDRAQGLRLVSQGYAVASVGYRLSQHATFPAQIQDCKAAVRWLRAHASEYKLDPTRFAAWGSSAGGHLVAMLGTTGDVKEFDVGPNLEYSSRVQAVVDFFGPADLLKMQAQSGPNSRMRHDTAESPEALLIGGTLNDNKEKAAKASPITYVTKDDAPMLLVHGDADPLVPHQQSEDLAAALKKAGVPATLHIVKGGGHGNGFGPEVQQVVSEFLQKWLKPGAGTKGERRQVNLN